MYRTQYVARDIFFTYSTPFILSSILDGTNNTPFFNGTAGTGSASSGNFGFNTFGLSASFGLNVQRNKGFLFEVIVFSSVLSSTQRQQIEGYLAWKWGLQANLPSTHPYKQSPVYQLPPFPLVNRVPRSTNRQLFLPSQITGCMLWLDGADPNNTGTPPANGSSISTWTDKSGNSRNFSGGVSPSYVRNGLNNKGIVRFSSGNYLVSGAVPLFSSSSSGGSFFFIFQTTNNEGQKFLLTYQNQVSGTYCQTESEIGIDTGNTTGSGNFGIHRGCSYASIAPANTIANSTFYMMGLLLLTTGNSPDNVNIYQNGNSLTVSNDNIGYYSAGSYPSANNSRSLVLGARSLVGASGPDGFITGDIAEVIWFSGPLSTTQRQQIEGYLAWKWGLQANLPSTHPYKQAPTYTLSPFPLVPAVTRSTGKAFTPTKISGCQVWLDAADRNSLTLTNSVVTLVKNKVDNSSLTPSGTSTSALTLVNSSIGKLQSLFFNNLANYNVWLQGSFGNISTASSFVVWKALSQKVMPQWSPFFTWYSKSGSTYGSYPAFGYLGGTTDLTIGPYTSFASPNGTPTTQLTANTNYLGFYGWNNTTTSVGLNGATPTSGTQPSFSGSTTTFLIGEDGDSNGPADAWAATNMYLGEILIFNRTITAIERQEIEGYLAWKWGLQSSLPQTHPWKLFPPPPN
jgi:hypothetical protein